MTETQSPPATDVPRDETHDSIDPATGTLTVEAVARRRTIMDELRAAGHEVGSWAEARLHLDKTPAPAAVKPAPEPHAEPEPLPAAGEKLFG